MARGRPQRFRPADAGPIWIPRVTAACRDADPELFFPAKKNRASLQTEAKAKTICQRCPLRAVCLDVALAAGEQWGIWGGLNPDERRKLIKATYANRAQPTLNRTRSTRAAARAAMGKPYPKDLRDHAIRLMLETGHQYPSRTQALEHIAATLGIGTGATIRNWLRQTHVAPTPAQEFGTPPSAGNDTPNGVIGEDLLSLIREN
jgi:WhiB family transcriptional regulator, redox-sensing transcriptional regulator